MRFKTLYLAAVMLLAALQVVHADTYSNVYTLADVTQGIRPGCKENIQAPPTGKLGCDDGALSTFVKIFAPLVMFLHHLQGEFFAPCGGSLGYADNLGGCYGRTCYRAGPPRPTG